MANAALVQSAQGATTYLWGYIQLLILLIYILLKIQANPSNNTSVLETQKIQFFSANMKYFIYFNTSTWKGLIEHVMPNLLNIHSLYKLYFLF